MTKNTLVTVIQSEHQECVWFAQYLEHLKEDGAIKMYTHIPNETYTPSWNAKKKNKLEGLVAGFPDYVIVTNHDVLFIEMKKSKGGVISDNQRKWLEALNAVGHKAVVCNGYENAKQWLNEQLSNIIIPEKMRGKFMSPKRGENG